MHIVGRSISLVAMVAVLATSAGALANDDVGHPALDGYCPVAYRFGKAVKGKPEFASDYEGKTYLFPKGEAKRMFDANPKGFTVAYDGWSATAIAKGKKVAADPTVFELYRDRTYRFADQKAKDTFDQNRDEWIARADAQWPKLAAHGTH
jgi:YHS domain-containing protein